MRHRRPRRLRRVRLGRVSTSRHSTSEGYLAVHPISSLHYVPISYTLASTKREVPVRSEDPSWNLAPLRGPAVGQNPFGPRGVPAATDHEGNPGIAEPSEAGRAVFPLRRRQRPRLHLRTGAAAPRGEVG